MIENKSSESKVSKKAMKGFAGLLEDKNIYTTHVLYL